MAPKVDCVMWIVFQTLIGAKELGIVERAVFLRDIDDFELFARALETYICDWFEQMCKLNETVLEFTEHAHAARSALFYLDYIDSIEELTTKLHASMSNLILDCGDRQKRLRDRTYGLPYRVVDKETPKSDPSPSGKGVDSSSNPGTGGNGDVP